jgi:hypothetical protein
LLVLELVLESTAEIADLAEKDTSCSGRLSMLMEEGFPPCSSAVARETLPVPLLLRDRVTI